MIFFCESTGGYYELYRLNLTALHPKETFFSINDKFHPTRTYFCIEKASLKSKTKHPILATHQESAVVDLGVWLSFVDSVSIGNLERIIIYCRDQTQNLQTNGHCAIQ